jgi:uncharacterized membrane protein (DUF4010 family)
MNEFEMLARVALAIAFGAVLGLETETRADEDHKETKADAKKRAELLKQRIGGVRTYTVLTLFGAVSGILYMAGAPMFAYITFSGVLLLVLAAYILNVQYRRAFGITSEIAILISVLVGFAAAAGIVSLPVLAAIVVLLAFILSQKRGIAKLVSRLAHQELEDVIKFLIVVIVVLPFLPNQDIFIRDIGGLQSFFATLGIDISQFLDLLVINPLRAWQYVVLISGFSIGGYFLSRWVGKAKAVFVTGALGGLISSTATTISLAHDAKHEKHKDGVKSFAAAALIATAVSFIPVTILAASTSIPFAGKVAMVGGLVAIVTIVYLLYLRRGLKTEHGTNAIEHKPFSIGPAVEFVMLLTLFRVLIQVAGIIGGVNLSFVVTAISGVIGIDVAAIALGEMVATGSMSLQFAVVGFLLANTVNFAAKVGYGYWYGGKRFASILTVCFSLGALASIAVLFL